MTAPQLTPSEVAAMQERCDKATAGPWFVDGSGFSNSVSQGTCWNDRGHEVCSDDMLIVNSDFIAHARTDMPRLLADRRAMAEECRKLREMLRHVADYGRCSGMSGPAPCGTCTEIETLLAAKGGEDG